MSEKNAIGVFRPTKNLVVTDTLNVNKSFHKESLITHAVIQVPALAVGAIAAAVSSSIDLIEGSLMFGGVGLFSSIVATIITSNNVKSEKVHEGLKLSKFSTLQKHLVPIGRMKNGTRLHLETFSIREAADIEIKELKANTEKVNESHATHTISHYMVKDQHGFRLEQESIPNPEAIWDASADALVEVHQVNESKKRYIFQPVF